VVVTVTSLKRHLAKHLEELALFAMPPGADESAESGSKNGKADQGDKHGIVLQVSIPTSYLSSTRHVIHSAYSLLQVIADDRA
jgi:hypothetical protein